jgi:diguanylate cyclase (GGDEF)-like protein
MTLNQLLPYITGITAAREHETLDAAMLAALCALTCATQCRTLEVIQAKDCRFVQPRCWMALDGSFESAAALGKEPERLPIARYPVLAAWARQGRGATVEAAEEGACVLWLPVWSDDGIASAFRLHYRSPLAAGSRAVVDALLQIYTSHRELIDYGERDSLTGLLNRKTFDARFARMACQVAAHETAHGPGGKERRHAGQAQSHWLAVADIDHFKKINDRFGHVYGDEVLILIANILRAAFRAQDRIFRFGGEEFVVLLRSVTQDSARRALERFREKVEAHDFPQLGKVSVSIGYVVITNDSPVEILGHADQALYYAKEHGRNQVAFYDELIASGLLRVERVNQMAELF